MLNIELWQRRKNNEPHDICNNGKRQLSFGKIHTVSLPFFHKSKSFIKK